MPRAADQLSFDELGTPQVTFVVVDLETTGGAPATDAITEIGAVKVRGAEVLGEFATGAVLVAHNAAFDTGFLQAASRRHDMHWPRPTVVCTARLARRVLSREEAPSCRLSALARLLHARTQPVHRALADARATVDVLHALLDRLGPLGVHSLEELLGYLPEVTAEQRRKRHLAAHLPHAPGVYLFRGPREEVLYVGTSRDLRTRVRQYFTVGSSSGGASLRTGRTGPVRRPVLRGTERGRVPAPCAPGAATFRGTR